MSTLPMLPSFPFEVNIELSTTCNAKCIICPNRKMQRQHMPDSTWRKIIDECAGHDVRLIYPHIYGEPLCEKRLWDVLEYIDKKVPQAPIGLFTNASLLTKEAGRRLLKHNLRFIAFSVDAATPATYNIMRPGLNYFEVVANIKDFLAHLKEINSQVFTRLQMVVRAENEHEALVARRLWEDSVHRVLTLGDDGRARMDGSDSAPAYKCNARSDCNAVFRSLYVLPNGDCVICCKDWPGLTVLGNVNQRSISKIWKGKEYNDVRSKLLRRDYEHIAACRACTDTLAPSEEGSD